MNLRDMAYFDPYTHIYIERKSCIRNIFLLSNSEITKNTFENVLKSFSFSVCQRILNSAASLKKCAGKWNWGKSISRSANTRVVFRKLAALPGTLCFQLLRRAAKLMDKRKTSFFSLCLPCPTAHILRRARTQKPNTEKLLIQSVDGSARWRSRSLVWHSISGCVSRMHNRKNETRPLAALDPLVVSSGARKIQRRQQRTCICGLAADTLCCLLHSSCRNSENAGGPYHVLLKFCELTLLPTSRWASTPSVN